MFDNNQPVNFVKGKKITDMKAGDTLYIQKTINNFSFTYYCEFISYEHGKVTGKVLDLDIAWAKSDIGKIITAKPCKCYLWGPRGEDRYIRGNCCHWFVNGVEHEESAVMFISDETNNISVIIYAIY